jgi:hypothetical protein
VSSREVDLIRLKIKRAEEHLAYFDDLIQGRQGPVKTPEVRRLHHNLDGETTHFYAEAPAPLPEWSIALGDIFHQLRGALDHVIYALAKRGNKTIPLKEIKKLAFPLCKTKDDFDNCRGFNRPLLLRHIGVDEFATVALSQPYQRLPAYPTELLYVLAELNNIDKHRAILVLSNQLGVSEHLPRFQTNSREEMESGAVRFTLNFPSSVKPSEVNMQDIHLRVSISEPGVYKAEAKATVVVEAMIRQVNFVLDRFEQFF